MDAAADTGVGRLGVEELARSPTRISAVALPPDPLRAGCDELLVLICEIAVLETRMAAAGAASRPHRT